MANFIDEINNISVPDASALPAAPAETTAAPQDTQQATPAVTVFDHINNVPIEIPETDLEGALASGQYTLERGSSVYMKSPDGQIGTISSDKVRDAIQNGFTIESSEDRYVRELQDKYGDREGEALLQGAARGLSFGLSDVLQTKTGFRSPEELAGLDEANPTASGIGEVGGVVGGLVIPVGWAGAGVKGAAKAGQVAERALAKQLTKAGVEKAIINKMLPKIAGSAVEGTFYGGGKLISEDALGRADFNAENLVGYLGTGALLGGSAAGALTGAGMLLEPVAQKIAPGVKFVADKIENKFFDKKRAATELANYSPSQAAKLGDRDPTLVADLPDFWKNKVGLKSLDNADDLVAKTEAVKQSAGKTIDDVLTKLEQSGLKADQRVWNDAAATIRNEVVGPYANTPGFETAVKRALKYADDVEALAASKEFGPLQIQKIRQHTDELINFGKRTDELPMIQEAAYKVRTALRGELDRIANSVDPKLAASLKEANKDYHISSEILPNLRKKAERSDFISLKDAVLSGAGVAGGPIGMGVAAASKFAESDLRRKFVILANIEKAQQKVFGQLKKSVDAFFDGSKKLQPVATQSLMRSELAADFKAQKPKMPKTREAAFNNISDNLNMYAKNPEALMERTNRVTAALYGGAPETTGAIDMTVQNAVAFLASKLPTRSTQGGILELLRPQRMPADYEIAKFERYVDAVESPVSVLKEFANGTVTSEGVEALRAVYPAMYEQVRNYAIEQLSTRGPEMSYQKRLQIGLLLDLPADESLLPENILGLQAQFNAQPEQQEGAVKPTQSGLSSLNLSENLETDLQAEDTLS